MYCSNCGARLDGGRFCSGCGTPAGGAPAQAAPAHQVARVRPAVSPMVDYTGYAILTLVAYFFAYPLGVILNIAFLFSGGGVRRQTGRAPGSMGCLHAQFWLLFIIPTVLGIAVTVCSGVLILLAMVLSAL